VFIGVLRHAIPMAWAPGERPAAAHAPGILEWLIVALPLAAVLISGLWMPPFAREAFAAAASVMGVLP